MRIVHVNQFYVPGLSYQENILPHEQARLGHDVWILTSDRLPRRLPGQGPGFSPGLLEEGPVRIWRLPAFVPVRSRAQVYLRGLSRALARLRPDVVNSHGLRFIPTLQTLSRDASFVHVGDDHSDNGNLPSGPANVGRWAVARWVCRRIHRKGGKIFTSNPFARWFVTEVFRAPPESVHLLPLGVNSDSFYPAPDRRAAWRQRLCLPETACAFVTSGRLTPGKGFELFFEAFAEVYRRVRESRLLLVGSGAPEYESRLHVLAADLGIERAVGFLPWLNEEELCACYNAADVGVMPGKLGGLREIIGAGKPLVAPDHLATSYLVQEGNGLLFSPDDRDSLARAMLRYAEDPGLRKQHGERSLQVAQGPLSWGQIARESLKVYGELLPGKGS